MFDAYLELGTRVGYVNEIRYCAEDSMDGQVGQGVVLGTP